MSREPKFKAKKKLMFEVKYQEINRFVKEVYTEIRDYNFIATEECGNDCSLTFQVDGSNISTQDWNKIKSGKESRYGNYDILNGLCKDGHIEAAEYVVNVCW